MGWNAWSIGTKIMTVAGTGVAAATPAIVVPVVLSQQNTLNPVEKLIETYKDKAYIATYYSQTQQAKLISYTNNNHDSIDKTETINYNFKANVESYIYYIDVYKTVDSALQYNLGNQLPHSYELKTNLSFKEQAHYIDNEVVKWVGIIDYSFNIKSKYVLCAYEGLVPSIQPASR